MPRYERLGPSHRIEDFDSGNEELDSWLHDSALTADRSGTARVYVWLSDEGQVAGYFALLPHTVRRAEIPPSVGRGSPDVIPGFLLARLALCRDLQGRGLGAEMLATAIGVILGAIKAAGGRLIVVDAIDDRAHSFYVKFGFRPIPDSARLVLKASSAAATLELDWP